MLTVTQARDSIKTDPTDIIDLLQDRIYKKIDKVESSLKWKVPRYLIEFDDIDIVINHFRQQGFYVEEGTDRDSEKRIITISW